jgi:excisionase family DNA binding protein
MESPQGQTSLIATPWMTVDDLAAYLSVSPGTVRNWVSQRYVPFSRRGRVVRFHKDRIDSWMSLGSCPGRRTPVQHFTPDTPEPSSQGTL